MQWDKIISIDLIRKILRKAKKENDQKEEKIIKKTKPKHNKEGEKINQIRMRNLSGIFLLFVFFSCDNTVYESHNSFEEKSWNSDSVITFNYNISDTLNPHEMSVLVRHTVDYEYQNLFLFLSGELNDTIELELADKIGKWKGSGLSDIREFEYLFAKNKVFSKKGNHSINIEQAMRFGAKEKIQNLEHVSDIGLIIRKQND